MIKYTNKIPTWLWTKLPMAFRRWYIRKMLWQIKEELNG